MQPILFLIIQFTNKYFHYDYVVALKIRFSTLHSVSTNELGSITKPCNTSKVISPLTQNSVSNRITDFRRKKIFCSWEQRKLALSILSRKFLDKMLWARLAGLQTKCSYKVAVSLDFLKKYTFKFHLQSDSNCVAQL